MLDFNSIQEEVYVIFHACTLGRSDVIKNVVQTFKSKFQYNDSTIAAILSFQRDEDQLTALHVATLHNHSDVIRSLLNLGADPSVRPSIGIHADKTAYEIANDATQGIYHVYFFEQIALGNARSVTQLIRCGISVHLVDQSTVADSALHWAVTFNQLEIIQILLSHGADILIKNKDNENCLHVVCANIHRLSSSQLNLQNLTVYHQLLTLLLQEGADPTAMDHKQRMPIDYLTSISASSSTHGSANSLDKVAESIDNSAHSVAHGPIDKLESLRKLFFDVAPIYTYRNQYLASLAATDALENNESTHGKHHHEIDNLDSDRQTSTNNCITVESQSSSHKSNRRNSVTDDGRTSSRTPNTKHALAQKNMAIVNPDHKHMQLWPPVHYLHLQLSAPLILTSSIAFSIYIHGRQQKENQVMTNRIKEAIHKSELLYTLMEHNFDITLFHKSEISKLRVYLDHQLCPGVNAYKLQINRDSITLHASDCCGILYGLCTLVQIIKLYSEVIRTNNTTTLYVPALVINDRPTFMHRAVLWSYRQHVRIDEKKMIDNLELFSKLRLNRLQLLIDHSADDLHRELQNIVSLCESYSIEVVPTFIIANTLHTPLFTKDTLNIFKTKTIHLHFTFNAIEIESSLPRGSEAPTHQELAVEALCVDYVSKLFYIMSTTEAHSVILTANEWTTRHVRPEAIATAAGLSVCVTDSNDLLHAALCHQPVLSIDAYAHTISDFVTAEGDKDHSSAVMPLFVESHTLSPAIGIKFCSFLFAAFAWNMEASKHLLFEGSVNNMNGTHDLTDFNDAYSAEHLKGLLQYFLFSNSTDALSKDMCNTLLQIFTGSWFQSYRYISDQNLSPKATSTHADHIISLTDYNTTEQFLQRFITTTPDTLANMDVPSQYCLTACLRYYRRLLTAAKWKRVRSKNKSFFENLTGYTLSYNARNSDSNFVEDDMNEYLSMIQLLSIICRALLLSYHSATKIDSSLSATSSMKFSNLIRYLPPGSKSDIANQLLESMEYFSTHWSNSYPHILYRPSSPDINNGNDAIVHNDSPTTITPSPEIVKNEHSHLFFNLSHDRPVIPLYAFFMLISENLPMPLPPAETIIKLFPDSEMNGKDL